MMELDDNTKNILIEHKGILKSNKFSDFYSSINLKYNTGHIVRGCTEAFLRAGINPLEYMSRVPDCYLYACTMYNNLVTIPENVKYIMSSAFSYADIGKLYVPDSIVDIMDTAFTDAGMTVVCSEKIKGLIEKRCKGIGNLMWEIV